MLSASARRAYSALATKLLREASQSSSPSSSMVAASATGRALSTSSTSSSASSAPSSPGIEFSGGVRVPHTTTLAFVGGTGYGTAGALHPDLLAAVARGAAAADEEEDGGGGGGAGAIGEAAAAAARRFASRPLPAYWTIDFAGNDVCAASPPDASSASVADAGADARGEFKDDDDLDETQAVALYSSIARLQTMDAVFYESQRQGRFSFYMTSAGEEATAVGSAAALKTSDPVFAQYREQGVLLHRGFSFRDFADQCFGNELEPGKGRQMPIHYGSRALAFHTISSPLATQLPQAVGAAYALSREQSGSRLEDRNVAVAYFGDGASSEGDFHAAANFAAVLAGKGGGGMGSDGIGGVGGDSAEAAGGTPLLLICRNNGWYGVFSVSFFFSFFFFFYQDCFFFFWLPRSRGSPLFFRSLSLFSLSLSPSLQNTPRPTPGPSPPRPPSSTQATASPAAARRTASPRSESTGATPAPCGE